MVPLVAFCFIYTHIAHAERDTCYKWRLIVVVVECLFVFLNWKTKPNSFFKLDVQNFICKKMHWHNKTLPMDDSASFDLTTMPIHLLLVQMLASNEQKKPHLTAFGPHFNFFFLFQFFTKIITNCILFVRLTRRVRFCPRLDCSANDDRVVIVRPHLTISTSVEFHRDPLTSGQSNNDQRPEALDVNIASWPPPKHAKKVPLVSERVIERKLKCDIRQVCWVTVCFALAFQWNSDTSLSAGVSGVSCVCVFLYCLFRANDIIITGFIYRLGR